MVFCDIRNNQGPGKCAGNLQISQLSSSSYLTYLWVALISKLCSMFLANEKTDSEHHV